jgi:hypothetical protein
MEYLLNMSKKSGIWVAEYRAMFGGANGTPISFRNIVGGWGHTKRDAVSSLYPKYRKLSSTVIRFTENEEEISKIVNMEC